MGYCPVTCKTQVWVQASGYEDLAKDIGHPPGAPTPEAGEWVGLCQAREDSTWEVPSRPTGQVLWIPSADGKKYFLMVLPGDLSLPDVKVFYKATGDGYLDM